MRQVTIIAGSCLVMLLTGCGVEHVSVRWDEPRPRSTVVYVSSDHVCTDHCYDHYWNGARVVVLSGHRHRAGCGHVFRGGRWIAFTGHHRVRGVRLDATHVCSSSCSDHYWTGSKYVLLKGHRHGPGCGHVFLRNRWLVSKSNSHKTRVVSPKVVRPRRLKHVAPRKGKGAKIHKKAHKATKAKVKKDRSGKGKSKVKKRKHRP